MPGTAKLAAVRLAAFVLLLVLAPVPSQAQTITNYKFAIVATQESMPDIIPSIEFALNDSKAALEAANATVELVQVALPAVPLFPLQHVSLLEYALLQQQFVAVINAMNDPVALAAIDNTTLPSIHINLHAGIGHEGEANMRIAVGYYLDALQQACQRFGWGRISIVISNDEENDAFIEFRKELTRRERAKLTPFNITMIREFSVDLTILANHDEAYANNSSVMVILGSADKVVRFIHVATSRRDDRMQYVWISPLTGGDQLDKFAAAAADLNIDYGGILAIIDDSTNNDSIYLEDRLSTYLNVTESTEEQLLAYDAGLVATDALVRQKVANRNVYDGVDFIETLEQSRVVGATGKFEFDENTFRSGDVRIVNLVFRPVQPGSGTTVEIRQYSIWSAANSFHQEFGSVQQDILWYDLRTQAPADGFSRKLEFAIVAPRTQFPVFGQWSDAVNVARMQARDANMLVDFDLNIHFIDSFSDEAAALQGLLEVIASENIAMTLGGAFSRVTIPLQYVLKSARITQMSPIESSTVMSDRAQNPYFARTTPNARPLFIALLDTVKRQFGWNNIAVLSSGDTDGAYASSAFVDIASELGMRIVITQSIEDLDVREIESSLSAIKKSGARVVFAALDLDHQKPVFEAAERLQMNAANGFTFLTSDTIHLNDIVDPEAAALIPEGTISVRPAPGSGPMWESFVTYSKAQLPANQNFSAMISSAYALDSFMSVYHAVSLLVGRGQDWKNNTLRHETLKEVDFVGATGRVRFQDGERLFGTASVVSRRSGKWVEFARVQFGDNITNIVQSTNTSAYSFVASAEIPKDLALNYIAWNNGAGIAMVILACIIIVGAVVVFILIQVWRENMMIRASSPAFLQVLLVGIILAVLSVIPSTGPPSDASCTVRTWLFVMGFVMAYGACLLKNWRVWRLWSDASMRIIRISNLNLLAYSSVFMIPFILLLVVWTSIDRPRAVIIDSNVVCTSGNSIVWPLLEFIGIGLMLVAGVILAFMTRAIPQLYNECKYIALATYNLTFCLVIGVVLSFVLQSASIVAAYLSYSVGVMFAFGGMGAIIFGPKLYLIILHPDKVAKLSSGRSSSGASRTQHTGTGTGTGTQPRSGGNSHALSGRGSKSSSRAKSNNSSGSKHVSSGSDSSHQTSPDAAVTKTEKKKKKTKQTETEMKQVSPSNE